MYEVEAEGHEEIAVGYFRDAANMGVAEAQFEMGKCCLLGKGIERNEEEGVAWLEKALLQNHPEASIFLGFCCEMGVGTEKKENLALRLYNKGLSLKADMKKVAEFNISIPTQN